MDKRVFFIAALLLACITIFSQTYDFIVKREAEELLTNGVGKKEFIKRCSSCHSLEKVIHHERSFENWSAVVLWMQKMQGMSPIPPKEQALIISYLEENYPMKNK
ncbi:MAG: hypothetical protein AB8G05_02315 [Oligoflexales bacterium]